MAASLNCPTCGAPAASADAAQCEYCGSTLTSIACPACFGPMFAGMEFCHRCGAKADRVVDANATLQCPGCKGTMRSVQVGATALFECAGCNSTWLDTETFSHLCLTREERGAVAAMIKRDTSTASKPATGGAVRYRPCPTCKRMMNRQNFGRVSGVIIDVCKGHGVWFESGELQSVMAFIDGGGLERTRALESQRRAEAIRREQPKPTDWWRDGKAPDGQVKPFVYHESNPESLLVEALNLLFG